MLWVQFPLSMDIPWPIIVRHYQILSVSTPLTTNKCTPLYKPTAIGGITFSGRRKSSTLIISLCSSYRHKGSCRTTTIKSGPHTYISSISTSSIRQGANRVTDYLIQPPVVALTTVLHSCGHEAYEWPNFISKIQTSPPPIIS